MQTCFQTAILSGLFFQINLGEFKSQILLSRNDTSLLTIFLSLCFDKHPHQSFRVKRKQGIRNFTWRKSLPTAEMKCAAFQWREVHGRSLLNHPPHLSRYFTLLRTWSMRENCLDLSVWDQGFISSLDNHEDVFSLRQKSYFLPSKNLHLHWAHHLHPQHSNVQPLLLICSPPMSTWWHGLPQSAMYQLSPKAVGEITVLLKLSYRSC